MGYELGGNKSANTDRIRPIHPGGPRPFQEKLMAPVVVEPISACQSRVHLNNLMPGTKFSVDVSGTPYGGHCTGDTSSSMTIPQDLVDNDWVVATQSLAGWPASDTGFGQVEAVSEMDPPQLFAPLCEGETRLRMTGILEESRLEVLVDGAVVGETVGPQEGLSLTAKLKKGQVVQVRFKLCGETLPRTTRYPRRTFPSTVSTTCGWCLAAAWECPATKTSIR